jgi:mannose/cellobiose epimerase-like protein (N-acyl-D-glucosamine 2-epimerase family)
MTQRLRSGCGSLVELGNYYWAYLDRKETSGQKRKRKTAARACKTRRRYTRRSSHKPSKSDEEDRDDTIVCITSLEPLRAKYLEWTHDLVQKEDWVGERELTLEDTEYPFEQPELGAKVIVASWEERSLDQSSCYYVRTRKPNSSEGSSALIEPGHILEWTILSA